MISYDLAGKCALVTGAASGIGLATARLLAGYGATVAVNHLADDERGPRAVAAIEAEGAGVVVLLRSAWWPGRSTPWAGSTSW